MLEQLENRRLMSASIVHRVLVIDGTGGDDQIQVKANGKSIIVQENGVEQSFNASHIRTILVNASGGDDSINLFQTLIPATVLGGAGDDNILGGGGPDLLSGGAGNDHIRDEGSGYDVLVGGQGDDILEGSALVGGPVEHITTYATDSTFYGCAGNDTIKGGTGDDNIFGGEGNDSIDGGVGNDRLRGEEGDDIIWDQSGRDHLDGGAGRDTLGDFGHEVIQSEPDIDVVQNAPSL